VTDDQRKLVLDHLPLAEETASYWAGRWKDRRRQDEHLASAYYGLVKAAIGYRGDPKTFGHVARLACKHQILKDKAKWRAWLYTESEIGYELENAHVYPNVVERAIHRENLARLDRAIAILGPVGRIAIRLRLAGRTDTEIARLTGSTQNTVSAAVYGAIRRLKRFLEEKPG